MMIVTVTCGDIIVWDGVCADMDCLRQLRAQLESKYTWRGGLVYKVKVDGLTYKVKVV